MLRSIVCASVVLAASFGLAMAEPVKGRIVSIEGKKITVLVGAKKGEKGESKTFDLGTDVKVLKVTGKDKSEPLAGGLGAPELKNIDAKKGVAGSLEVNGNTVSEIRIMIFGKKKDS